MVATGSVIFDQGDDQRITGATAVWNYKTKLGTFEDSTGFTNQTNDGTVIYFTAERVERVSLNEIVVTKGKFTACEEAVPKWSFTAERATDQNERQAKAEKRQIPHQGHPARDPAFRLDPDQGKGPQFGISDADDRLFEPKGCAAFDAYYQTLGDSADVTFRGDIYTARGIRLRPRCSHARQFAIVF